ncbi:hypothetical protein U8C32_28980 (plasmid) [Sinorhizobium medicae]|uniref:hypothetical protein n=1 Tax=Sinorhizobium medicae TaxID=110321 RepID=UPI002AF6C9E7|nr:hypothetical protein [Sinorhizobium medicae]WQO95225.1 hypothetical protein U8C32_28980 [Sinorhizobium medicae]
MAVIGEFTINGNNSIIGNVRTLTVSMRVRLDLEQQIGVRQTQAVRQRWRTPVPARPQSHRGVHVRPNVLNRGYRRRRFIHSLEEDAVFLPGRIVGDRQLSGRP